MLANMQYQNLEESCRYLLCDTYTANLRMAVHMHSRYPRQYFTRIARIQRVSVEQLDIPAEMDFSRLNCDIYSLGKPTRIHIDIHMMRGA